MKRNHNEKMQGAATTKRNKIIIEILRNTENTATIYREWRELDTDDETTKYKIVFNFVKSTVTFYNIKNKTFETTKENIEYMREWLKHYTDNNGSYYDKYGNVVFKNRIDFATEFYILKKLYYQASDKKVMDLFFQMVEIQIKSNHKYLFSNGITYRQYHENNEMIWNLQTELDILKGLFTKHLNEIETQKRLTECKKSIKKIDFTKATKKEIETYYNNLSDLNRQKSLHNGLVVQCELCNKIYNTPFTKNADALQSCFCVFLECYNSFKTKEQFDNLFGLCSKSVSKVYYGKKHDNNYSETEKQTNDLIISVVDTVNQKNHFFDNIETDFIETETYNETLNILNKYQETLKDNRAYIFNCMFNGDYNAKAISKVLNISVREVQRLHKDIQQKLSIYFTDFLDRKRVKNRYKNDCNGNAFAPVGNQFNSYRKEKVNKI